LNGPVLQQGPLKVFGSGWQIIEGCCYKDKRNAQKFDEKKRPVKRAKGWTPAPPLNPAVSQDEINSMICWFNQNLRPHSQRLFHICVTKPDEAFSSGQKDELEEAAE